MAESSVATRSPRRSSRKSSTSGTEQILKPGFAVQLHTFRFEKDVSGNAVELDKEYLLCKGHRQTIPHNGKFSARLTFHTRVTFHLTTKSELATPDKDVLSSCEDELKGRSKSCNCFIRGAVIGNSSESRQSTAELRCLSQGAMASSL